MSDQIPASVIARLIGAANAPDIDLALRDAFPVETRDAHSHLTRLLPTPWQRVGEDSTHDDLVALIRALTVAEASLGWLSGSVSPVIWLFRVFRARFTSESDALAEWVLAHTQNDYLPYGSMNLGARSLAELAQRREACATRAAKSQETEALRQKAARAAKAERATANLHGAVRRGDAKAVAALLAQGADCLAIGPSGVSALDLARQLGHGDVVTALLPVIPDV